MYNLNVFWLTHSISLYRLNQTAAFLEYCSSTNSYLSVIQLYADANVQISFRKPETDLLQTKTILYTIF